MTNVERFAVSADRCLLERLDALDRECGCVDRVKRLSDMLIAVKGVKHGKAVLTVEGEDLP